eukprot:COSAG04_NODE_7094_length_1193_cov_15.787020_1_plen_301_part_10
MSVRSPRTPEHELPPGRLVRQRSNSLPAQPQSPLRRAASPPASSLRRSPGRRRVAALPQGPAQRAEWSEEAEINQQRHAQRRAASRERRRQQDERLQAALSIQRFVSVSDSTSQRRRAARSPPRSPSRPLSEGRPGSSSRRSPPASPPSPRRPADEQPAAAATEQDDAAPVRRLDYNAEPAAEPWLCCPASHRLAPFRTPIAGYRCDRCGATAPAEESMWSCGPCEHDVCVACYAKGAKGRTTDDEPAPAPTKELRESEQGEATRRREPSSPRSPPPRQSAGRKGPPQRTGACGCCGARPA